MTEFDATLEVLTGSADATRRVGSALAELVQPGDLVLLVGELGAGKTALAGGLVHALGVSEPVPSPTFALAREYHGRLAIAHLDVYRLDHLQEFYDLGIDDYLDGEWLLLIEWGDVVADALPADRLDVVLDYVDAARGTDAGTDDRSISFEPRGTWRDRHDALAAALRRFRAGR